MPPLAPKILAATGRQCAQGHALIDLHPVTDNGGLADDDAGAVVNEKVLSDGGTGVDIDAGDGVGMLRHDPGDHGNAHFIQHMGQPVNRNGKKARVGENDLFLSCRSRVTVVGCLQIRLDQRANLGDLPEEGQTDPLGFLLILDHQTHLAVQIEHHILNEHGQIVLCVVYPVGFFRKIPGEDDPAELADHIDDDVLIRLLEQVDAVNVPAVGIVLQNGIHDSLNFFFKRCHNDPSTNIWVIPYYARFVNGIIDIAFSRGYNLENKSGGHAYG